MGPLARTHSLTRTRWQPPLTGVKPFFCRPLRMGTISSSLSHRMLRRWNALQGACLGRLACGSCRSSPPCERRAASGERRAAGGEPPGHRSSGLRFRRPSTRNLDSSASAAGDAPKAPGSPEWAGWPPLAEHGGRAPQAAAACRCDLHGCVCACKLGFKCAGAL